MANPIRKIINKAKTNAEYYKLGRKAEVSKMRRQDIETNIRTMRPHDQEAAGRMEQEYSTFKKKDDKDMDTAVKKTTKKIVRYNQI